MKDWVVCVCKLCAKCKCWHGSSAMALLGAAFCGLVWCCSVNVASCTFRLGLAPACQAVGIAYVHKR